MFLLSNKIKYPKHLEMLCNECLFNVSDLKHVKTNRCLCYQLNSNCCFILPRAKI